MCKNVLNVICDRKPKKVFEKVLKFNYEKCSKYFWKVYTKILHWIKISKKLRRILRTENSRANLSSELSSIRNNGNNLNSNFKVFKNKTKPVKEKSRKKRMKRKNQRI